MIVQDVTTFPTFNPHGGPITHNSTGSKPDPPVPPFPKSILTLGFVCNSRATFLVIYSGIRRNTYSCCSEPLFTLRFRQRAIACPLGISHYTSLLCSRYFLKFQFKRYLFHLPWGYRLGSRPCRGLFFRNTHPLLFRKYDRVPKERMSTSSWEPEAEKWRHQGYGSAFSRRSTKTENTR